MYHLQVLRWHAPVAILILGDDVISENMHDVYEGDDEEAVDVVRSFTKLKAKLMPYLYKTAVQAATLGIPTMRSMVMEFTEDKLNELLTTMS